LVADSVDRISKIIIGLIVLIYIWRLVAGGQLGDRVRDWAANLCRDVDAVYLAARDPRVPVARQGIRADDCCRPRSSTSIGGARRSWLRRQPTGAWVPRSLSFGRSPPRSSFAG
jgi:hypothetical protein